MLSPKGFKDSFPVIDFSGLGFALQSPKEFPQARVDRYKRVLESCQETLRHIQDNCVLVCLIYKELQRWLAFAPSTQHVFFLW